MNRVFFVTGIDTGTGKSYATGYIARQYAMNGKKVITQKFIQTGNTGISEDIETHRKIMKTGLLPEDIDRITCPVVLSYPASPHLAAKIDSRNIEIEKITASTVLLLETYDIVLIEGAGGIMTPVNDSYTTVNYIIDRQLPVIIVTSSKLGSINHTLLTLEICKSNNIEVNSLVYNKFGIDDKLICSDTEIYLKRYIAKNFKDCLWIELPELSV
ncbi:MAG: dethiobiotin synthase [Prevotellaceae bacterium]|jgi:dethiobiotin synthetase|nr:dethiobiotin synthase [Prevotellaceae bacterium]